MARTSIVPHAWEFVDDILVTRTVPGEIDSTTWDGFIRALREPRVRLVFAVVEGSVQISALQRRQAADGLRERELEAIVLTDNALTRGMLTAMSWLGAKMKPFAWKDIDRAVQHTGAPPVTQTKLRAAAEAFKAEALEAVGTG